VKDNGTAVPKEPNLLLPQRNASLWKAVFVMHSVLNLSKIVPAVWLISIFGVVYLSLAPTVEQPLGFWGSDKIYHLILYSWLAFLPAVYFDSGRGLHAASAMIVMGTALEFLQQYTGRQFSSVDMISNVFGVIIGWRVGLSVKDIFGRRQKQLPLPQKSGYPHQ
jgi:VanZ family protein